MEKRKKKVIIKLMVHCKDDLELLQEAEVSARKVRHELVNCGISIDVPAHSVGDFTKSAHEFLNTWCKKHGLKIVIGCKKPPY